MNLKFYLEFQLMKFLTLQAALGKKDDMFFVSLKSCPCRCTSTQNVDVIGKSFFFFTNVNVGPLI